MDARRVKPMMTLVSRFKIGLDVNLARDMFSP